MERISATYRYSYEELCSRKNRLVIFRMYQMDLNGTWPTYRAYWDRWPPPLGLEIRPCNLRKGVL